MPATTPHFATSGRRLATNALWNLLGQACPLLVAVIAIPILLASLGPARFGILSLAWVTLGYFSLFDLGLGRALTQLLSRSLAAAHPDLDGQIRTALVMTFLVGLAAMIVVALSANLIVTRVFRIPAALQPESLAALLVLAASLPILTTTGALRAVLEAHQRFRAASLVLLQLGIFTFLGPLLPLPFSRNLAWIVLTLVISRVVAWGEYAVLAVRTVPALAGRLQIEPRTIGPLFRFGGWMTVSNVISPLMVYVDRFVIGIAISSAAITYYAVPYEIITRLWIVPTAVVAVLFPAVSAASIGDPLRVARLFERASKAILLVVFPVALLTVVLANQLLVIWLGRPLAAHSSHVLQYLAIGVFLNSVAQVTYTLIQASGRPDLTAILHLLELPVYLALLASLLRTDGIDGVAIAWTLRVALDLLLLWIVGWRLLRVAPWTSRTLFPTIIACCGLLVIALLLTSGSQRALFLGAVFVGFGIHVWRNLLTPADRTFGRSLFSMSLLS